MTKVYLKTLSSFYYEQMIASAPSDFTNMVNMGMCLEEGVRDGQLVKEGGSSSGVRKFGVGFPKKKEQDINMVVHKRPRQRYQQQHIAAVAPAYQPQFLQLPQPQVQQRQQQPQFTQQQPRYIQHNTIQQQQRPQ